VCCVGGYVGLRGGGGDGGRLARKMAAIFEERNSMTLYPVEDKPLVEKFK
jgi:hypothetical protein